MGGVETQESMQNSGVLSFPPRTENGRHTLTVPLVVQRIGREIPDLETGVRFPPRGHEEQKQA